MRTLRLILGDQLNSKHSWFSKVDDEVIYVLMEMRQETDYVVHHIQKVVAFFMSMRSFSNTLQAAGHRVIYYSLDYFNNKQNLQKNIQQLCIEHKIEQFQYQQPDEYRLQLQLEELSRFLKIPVHSYDTEHFLSSRTELATFFEGKKQWTMEYFYRYMRKKYNVLMLDSQNPEGDKWNFDHNNRKKWKGEHLIPPPKLQIKEAAKIVALLKKMKVVTMGSISPSQFNWPISRTESLALLDYFCKHLLIHFGDYQDAMHTEYYYLFHSNLSFAINVKMLHPLEVVETVIAHWEKNKNTISITQTEGFVRQIIGWREYMYGMYWAKMPNYITLNTLENNNPLPNFYWTGKTKMNCLKHTITQSLQTGYAHHIQRLMITGNYALLTQTHPDEVDRWYLGIYTDAIQWVQLPNTRGMSQFADGGIVATKPYVSSGSYINKMSNYCKGCTYKVAQKTGEEACPFNALYWNFLYVKRNLLQSNPRMSMMYRLLDKMDNTTLEAHLKRANYIIHHPNEY